MSDLIIHYRQLAGIAKTWGLKNLPGWSDDAHQDVLVRHGAQRVQGRASATTLNVPQLDAVLEDYERRGWQRTRRVFKPAGSTAAVRVPQRIAHIVRLWGRLARAGRIDQPGRPGLLAFAARQTGRAVKNLDDLSVQECQRLTEALKGWLNRIA